MEQERRARQQIGAIILFALGLLFICLSFIEGQNVWNWIHNRMFGLFGWCSLAHRPYLRCHCHCGDHG